MKLRLLQKCSFVKTTKHVKSFVLAIMLLMYVMSHEYQHLTFWFCSRSEANC